MTDPIQLPTDRPPERAASFPSRLVSRADGLLRGTLPRPLYHFGRGRYYDARRLVGRSPGRGRMLPDYLIIGVAKGGTTTLCAWLNEHPFISPAAHKELHYFDYEFPRGEDWYRSHFPLESDRHTFELEHGRPFLTGEASPTYISHAWAPERIARALPNARLIVALRDPVDRAYSHYQMTRREGEEPLESFAEAVDAEEGRLAPEVARSAADRRYNSWPLGCWSYLRRSRYAEQLERWFQLFPRDQFHFVKNEDLAENPAATLGSVHDFLELPPHDKQDFPKFHVASYSGMTPETRAKLVEYFRPHNERLYELVGIDFGWERDAAPAAPAASTS